MTNVNPVDITAGIASGLVARLWAEVVLSALLAPLFYWVCATLFSRTIYIRTLAPAFTVAGLLCGGGHVCI